MRVKFLTSTATWTLTNRADWLWGSERGEAVITHTGYYSRGSFNYHNYSASHYMTLGNSDAQVTAINSKTIAYGYGLILQPGKICSTR
jgi:hypothetical protein